MSKRNKPRLGKGLSALIGDAVKIDQDPQNTVHNTNNTSPATDKKMPAQAIEPKPAGRQLLMVPLGSILPSPYQPRSAIEESTLKGLADSIRQTGVMQPIVIRAASGGGEKGGDEWELIAGERRWRAAQIAGLDSIPAVQADVDDQTAAEWALIENVQREELNPIERALALRTLRDRFGLTQSEIASHIGLERSSVANLLRLTDLPRDVQQLIANGKLSAGHGKALAGIESNARNTTDILILAQHSIDHAWSVRRLEKEIAQQRNGKESSGMRAPQIVDTHTDIERQLSEYFGTKVQIRTDKSGLKGQIQVRFFDVQHFEDLVTRMGVRLQS